MCQLGCCLNRTMWFEWHLTAVLSITTQLNTKDILFICGGAFVNLDRLVAERTSTASLGFGNPVCSLARAPSPGT